MAISRRDTMFLHPFMKTAMDKMLKAYYRRSGGAFRLVVTDVHRSMSVQAALHKKGVTANSGASGSYSRHNYMPSTAFDVAVIGGADTERTDDDRAIWDIERYKEIGVLCSELGTFWGGWWKSLVDGPHVQMSTGDWYREWQVMLKVLGAYKGRIDGMFGKRSCAALRVVFSYPGLEHNMTPSIWPNAWSTLWNKCYGSDPNEWVQNWWDGESPLAVVRGWRSPRFS